MVGVEHTWFDAFGGIHQLLWSHGVGLVAGQESNVDLAHLVHLGDVLSIASHIDTQVVEGQDKTVVAAFGVELFTTGSGVVGGNSLYLDVVECRRITVGHHLTIAQHLCATCVGHQSGAFFRQRLDGFLVEMVAMLMRHQDEVGLGLLAVIHTAVAKTANGVDLYLPTIISDADGCVDQGFKFQGMTCLGHKLIAAFHCIFTAFHCRAPCQVPSQNATFQVHYRETFFHQHRCGLGRTASAFAIHGDRTVFVQQVKGVVQEMLFRHVDIHSACNMSVSVFFVGADIYQLYIVASDEIFKRFGIDRLKGGRSGAANG